MKKILAILLTVTMLTVLLAAAGNIFAAEDSVSEEKVLHVLLEAEPDTIDPSNFKTQASHVVGPFTTACFVPLVISEDNQTIEPYLLAEWEWIDETHLHATIRDDVVSRSGHVINTEDVLYTFKTATTSESVSFFDMFDVENFVIEDDTNMVFALLTPYPSLIEAFLNPVYSVFSKEDIDSLSDPNSIAAACTGRYYFDEWKPGQYITVLKNENYFDKDTEGYYDKIIFTFNNDASARVLALKSGDCDVTINVAVNQAAGLEADGFKTNLHDTADVMNVYLNCSRAPFDNELVRKAFNMLVNRAAVRAVLYDGYGSILAAPFSEATAYYQPYEAEVDVEGAKALLAEAGYPNGFGFTLSGLQNTQIAAEVIQANLAEAGINMDISMMDFGGYISTRVSGQYDALIGIGGGADFANVLQGYDGRLSIQEAFGGTQYYGDEKSYELIDTVYGELDLEKRQIAMKELCDYMVDKGVMVALCSVSEVDPCKGNLTGMRFQTAVFVDVSWMHPEE